MPLQRANNVPSVFSSGMRQKQIAPYVPREPPPVRTARLSARDAISAGSAPTVRAVPVMQDVTPTPGAAPIAPSAPPAKSPTIKARRAPYRIGKLQRCAGATARGTWTTRTTTSTPGCAWHVQRVRTAALARLALRQEFLRNGIIAASAGTRRCSERVPRPKPAC